MNLLRSGLRACTVAGLALILGSCATLNPYFDATRPHHRRDGFQNLHTQATTKGLGEFLRWRWNAARQGLPPPPLTPTPTQPPDLDFLRRNSAAGAAMTPAMTWIGHATMLAQFGGLTWITDPVFSERASPLPFFGPKRAQAPGVALRDLPHVDVVLVSHNHYDHLDEASVLALQAQAGGPPLFVAPLGVGAWLRERGMTRVVELDWWQEHRIGTIDVVLTPAQHWSGRGLHDRLATLWGGFAVFSPDFHFYYSGDTGYSPDFRDIAARFAPRQATGGFDVALIPVGAYEPRWFMAAQHVDPDEALQIHVDVRAKRSIGVHWGTFELTDEPLDTPPVALATARRARGISESAFGVMAIGQTLRLPRRAAQPG